MIKFYRFLFLTIFVICLSSCSFDKKTGIWKNERKQKEENVKLIKLSDKGKVIQEEINKDFLIKIKSKGISNKSWPMSGLNYLNSINSLKFDGNFNKSSKFKFKKFSKKEIKENTLVVGENYFVTVNGKGSILKFNKKEKLIWIKNFYTRKERKKVENISFAVSNNALYVTDNLGKLYSLNINSGEKIWSSKHLIGFNSQIKVFNNKIFVVDNENTILCFSTIDGKKLWNFETQSTFIKSNKKLSIIINDKHVLFSNSAGDITKLNANDGELNWLMPTQNTLVQHSTNFLETSDIILHNESIFFSNNFSKLYSLDYKTGLLNWIININSSLRPIILDNYLFTISKDGYLIVVNIVNGEILRSTFILGEFKKKKRKKIQLNGFIISSNKMYITTNIGFLIICDINSGKIEKIIKIRGSQLSEPLISNGEFYILTDNSVIVY